MEKADLVVQEINNVIFLDIDEVLCTNRSREAFRRLEALDPVSCEFLLHLCKKFKCKIVIHSSWRFIPNGIDMFRQEVSIACPALLDYIYTGDKECTTTEETDRVKSIIEWLIKYAREETIKNYIIIDDLYLTFPPDYKHMAEHFFRIHNPNIGLDFVDYKKIKEFLEEDEY